MDYQAKIQVLQDNIQKVIVGKPEAVRLSLVALLARGHLLIEDVPGVGKTTLAHSLARSLGGTFQRIQFTSDLLPSDILGVSIYDQRTGEFQFKPGPIFANVVLADEINRTTPKTQSSLLEAMNDFQVSVDHRTYKLPRPFIVLATQNPLEYQGTHPLPESQMDRFLLRIRIGYPQEVDEKRILQGRRAVSSVEELGPVISAEEVLVLQRCVEGVRVDESLVDYLMAIVQATRRSEALALGVSPRGSLSLHRAAQALAFIEGRDYCVPDDIKSLAISALAHRVMAKTRWRLGEGRTEEEEEILWGILQETPIPR
ncbi:MAG: MoxR family ATPase [candidate division NC10 bacterium]|nr:MoxR family ATPase [candidate division NC10 bacterium]